MDTFDDKCFFAKQKNNFCKNTQGNDYMLLLCQFSQTPKFQVTPKAMSLNEMNTTSIRHSF